MFLELTKEQEMVKKSAIQFAEKTLKAIAYEDDRNARYPQEAVEEMGKLQFLGMRAPKAAGGEEMDFLTVALTAKELGKANASVASVFLTHVVQATETIVKYGSDAQKEKYLPKLSSGELLGGYAYIEDRGTAGFTEDGVTAKKGQEGYLLSGKKSLAFGGGVAGVYVVIAGLEMEDGTRKLSAFLVEGKDVKVGPSVDKLGLRSFPTTELIFDEVKGELLGEEAAGGAIMDEITGKTNIISGAIAAGIAEAARDESIAHCKTRVQFGAPIARIQAVQFLLADIEVSLHAMDQAAMMAAMAVDRGEAAALEGAFVKKTVQAAGHTAGMNAVQIHGGIGYSREANIERYFRDIRGMASVESMREYPEKIIAAKLLK